MHFKLTLPFAAVALLFSLAGCWPDSPAQENSAANNPAPVAQKTQPGGEISDASKQVRAVIATSMGEIELELNAEKAPITVENFVSYAKKGHFNGTLFHRVIPGFMIQGGGFDEKLVEKPTDEPIKNEVSNGLLNDRGTIAMARTSDPDSATSQFFINVADNSVKLGPGGVDTTGYAVFGKVTKGMDVADKIVAVPTTTAPQGLQNCPVDNVVIKSVKIVEGKAAGG